MLSRGLRKGAKNDKQRESVFKVSLLNKKIRAQTTRQLLKNRKDQYQI